MITGSASFQCAYGIAFSASSAGDIDHTNFVLFADVNSNGKFDGETSGEAVTTYTLKRGIVIAGVCAVSGSATCETSAENVLNITFKRPDPSAVIRLGDSGQTYDYAKITLRSTDGSERSISVRRNGQISVDI